MFFLHYCLHIKDKVFIVKNELAFYIFGISNHLLLYVRLVLELYKFKILPIIT